MYHEEEIIDGILCHRGTPDGEWVPYTLEALTIALTAERGQRLKHLDAWLRDRNQLDAIRAILGIS